MTTDRDEIPLLILIDPAKWSAFAEHVQEIHSRGATIIQTLPQIGVVVVYFPEHRIEELRQIDGVVNVERSRRLTY